MKPHVIRFIDDYFRDLETGDAGIFAGAGLSVPAGFVDWRDLLRPLANEIDLDIARETDMVAIAQFHVNANGMNRARLHRAVVEAFSSDAPPTANHRLLAQLPVTTWWTTNYDKLIETALRDAGKIVDVKYTVPQLAITAPRRDAIVYKMHGDVEHPNQAVATRDDYEGYSTTRGAFINALAGDLVSKTFLFLGFSFTDPNLEQVLSRIRLTFRQDQRRHYAIFRNCKRGPDDDDATFAHARVRQELVLKDLER
ncbi:MAG: SIR2 family protein [Sphingomonas sp.]|uniref:SIR2 family NAD-dependent protein deacylase n=1 Tax=Sphingomonas sp. TaxID=28214 RepID=UPI001ACE8009|nr:SIR2 family protein [Sphingomonas sp.]MBN8816530.1 SIR2 family protein [Sphingomonas sp.]